MGETRPLRCVRCGDPLFHFDPADVWQNGTCSACWNKSMAALRVSLDAFLRFMAKFSRGADRHPTVRAIRAYWTAEFASVPASTEPF